MEETFEAAPSRLRAWTTQRTRWFKGWFQTYGVHMRAPARLAREIGWGAFVRFHLCITGMLVSALVHPVLLVSVVWNGAAWAMGAATPATDA